MSLTYQEDELKSLISRLEKRERVARRRAIISILIPLALAGALIFFVVREVQRSDERLVVARSELVRSLEGLAVIYSNRGQYSLALSHFQEALVVRREEGDRAGEGATLNQIGMVYNSQGDYDQALSYYQQALVILREVGDQVAQAATLDNIGMVYSSKGDYDQAISYFQQALVILRESND